MMINEQQIQLPSGDLVMDYSVAIDSGLTLGTVQQLLSVAQDERSSHMLWVSKDGYAHLTELPIDMVPAYLHSLLEPRLQFRFETFAQGNKYAGSSAAKDERWSKRVQIAVNTNWTEKNCGFIDEI